MRIAPFLCALVCLVAGCGEGRLAATFEESFAVGDASELLLDNGSGDLSIVGEDDRAEVTLIVELRSFRVSELDDDEAKRAVVIDVHSIDDATAEIVAALRDPPPGYHIDVTAIVPAHVAMRVDDNSGDLGIEGIAGLELNDDSGDARIAAIAGDVIVDDDSGDLTIAGVDGNVDVDDGSGDLRVRDVTGDAFVRDDSGDVSVVGVGGLVTLRDGSGDIFVADVGDVTVESDGSGDVHIE
jgi:hypothetical protein